MNREGYGYKELISRGRGTTSRVRLKSCPRCKGDIVTELDHWGWYEECIQCGYLHDLPNAVKQKQQSA